MRDAENPVALLLSADAATPPHQPPMAKFFSLHKVKMYSCTVKKPLLRSFPLNKHTLGFPLQNQEQARKARTPSLPSQKNEETKPGKKNKENKTIPRKALLKSFYFDDQTQSLLKYFFLETP